MYWTPQMPSMSRLGDIGSVFPFAVCNLSRYDVIIGVRWREDKGARINYKNNKITIKHKRKSITIKATLQPSNTISL